MWRARTAAWEGDDFPNALPLDLGEPVALTIGNSRHYSYSGDARYEYHSIYPGEDLGFVRLGPNKRFFSFTLYHQIHCLETLRRAIVNPNEEHKHGGSEILNGDGRRAEPRAKGEGEGAHWSHCLNYLRQTLMCSADLTLEPEIELGSGNVGEGLHVTHVCKDWSKVHAFTAKNWDDYWELKKGNVTKTSDGVV